MRRCGPGWLLMPLLLLGAGSALRGEEKKPEPVSFTRQVFPLFKDRCITCHSGSQPMKNLSLETPETIMKGGDQGPILVKGKSAESLVVQYLTGQRSPKMPPNEELDSGQIDLVKRWIDEGARFDVPKKDGK